MINPRFSEDEQAERLKEWWKKNGTSIVFGVVIGVVAIGGVNYWRDYTRNQAEAASERYVQLLTTSGDAAQDLASGLMQDHAGSPYAGLAALYAAREHYDAGDPDAAEAKLRWVLDNVEQAELQHAARLRLGRLLMDRDRLAAGPEHSL